MTLLSVHLSNVFGYETISSTHDLSGITETRIGSVPRVDSIPSQTVLVHVVVDLTRIGNGFQDVTEERDLGGVVFDLVRIGYAKPTGRQRRDFGMEVLNTSKICP